MTNIKQPRLHNIHVRNISGEIDDNNVDTNAKLNSWNRKEMKENSHLIFVDSFFVVFHQP